MNKEMGKISERIESSADKSRATRRIKFSGEIALQQQIDNEPIIEEARESVKK